MTLLKDNNYKEINVALLSLEADIKNKITNIDTSVIDRQLAEINSRIDKINAGGNNSSATINDIRTEIEDINSKLNGNSAKIENIEQKLSDIFSAENKVTDFNTTTDSGIYYWLTDAANKPGTDYGVLLVNKYDRRDNYSIWINQIAYGTNNKIYFRQNINSIGWREWKAIAFEGELNADTVDNYHASQLWRSDGATWNPNANVVMTPSGNGSEWSFDFRNKNGATGSYWQVWDENKNTLLKVNADDGKVSAPYGFVGNLSGKADTAGTADKVASAGSSTMWIYGRNDAICKTTSAAENGGWKTLASIKTASGSYEIGNLYGEDFIRVVYSSDADVNAGNNDVTQLLYIRKGNIETPREFIANSAKASSKMVIPIGAPSSLEDGCIWIER